MTVDPEQPEPDAAADGRAGPEEDATLRRAITSRIADDPAVADAPGDRTVLRAAVARALAAEGVVVSPTRWAALVRRIVDDLGGLGPLEVLLRDPAVTDVMVNGPAEVFVERDGRLEETEATFAETDEIVTMLRRVLGPLGARLDRAHPFVDAVLPTGVRLHAVIPPLVEVPTVTLRRVPAVVPTWEELASGDAVPADLAADLRGAVVERRNLVVCGPAGSGKTTLLSRLLAETATDRVVVIEDAPELTAPTAHTVHLRVRPASPDGVGAVDVASLVRNALRMRPDRLVVGEVRGAEVADMLQAMNTGHAGSMTTVHASGAEDALTRLEGMTLLAGVPLAAVRAQLASALDLVVGMTRDRDGRRRVRAVAEISGGPAQLRARRVWP